MRSSRQEEDQEGLETPEVQGTGRPGGGGGGLQIPRAGQQAMPEAGAGGPRGPRGTEAPGPVTVSEEYNLSTILLYVPYPYVPGAGGGGCSSVPQQQCRTVHHQQCREVPRRRCSQVSR